MNRPQYVGGDYFIMLAVIVLGMFLTAAIARPDEPPVARVDDMPPVALVDHVVGVNKKALSPTQPGTHWHRRTDGSYYQHADTNQGNHAAHAGVAWPWIKTGPPPQSVEITRQTQDLGHSCPT